MTSRSTPAATKTPKKTQGGLVSSYVLPRTGSFTRVVMSNGILGLSTGGDGGTGWSQRRAAWGDMDGDGACRRRPLSSHES